MFIPDDETEKYHSTYLSHDPKNFTLHGWLKLCYELWGIFLFDISMSPGHFW